MKYKLISIVMLTMWILLPQVLKAEVDEISVLREQLESLKAQVQEMESRLASAQINTSVIGAESIAQESMIATQARVEPVVPDSIVHLAGYGAAQYEDRENADGGFGSILFAPIFHYQYKDLLLFEGELEIEIEEDGDTEVALEYLTLDLILNDNATLIAGKYLSPIGQFRQNLHPSWINKLPSAPPGFGHDQAAPLADVGVQLRGGFGLGNGSANYELFASNGPQLDIEFEEEDDHGDVLTLQDGDDDEPGEGEFEIHGLESEGYVSNEDGELIFGGRIGFLPWSNFEVGLSLATGEIGLYSEGELIHDEPTRDYDVHGVDFYYTHENLQLRGEYVTQKIGDEQNSIVPDEAKWTAWYTQASYRFPQSMWEGVLRYSDFDALETHDDQEQLTIGVNYLFANNVIGKIAYELNDGEAGSDADGNRVVLQLAYGF